MSGDLGNALYELVGAGAIFWNCWLTWKARRIEGVSIMSTLFLASWSFWNLYYYPSIGQWWSFGGGLVMAAANSTWIQLMVHFSGGWKGVKRRVWGWVVMLHAYAYDWSLWRRK